MAYTVIYLIEAKDCIDETVTQHQTGSGDLGSITNETIVTLDNLNEIGFVGFEDPYDDYKHILLLALNSKAFDDLISSLTSCVSLEEFVCTGVVSVDKNRMVKFWM